MGYKVEEPDANAEESVWEGLYNVDERERGRGRDSLEFVYFGTQVATAPPGETLTCGPAPE